MIVIGHREAAALFRHVNEMRNSLYPGRLAAVNLGLETASFGAGALSQGGSTLKPFFDAFNGLKRGFDPEGELANQFGKVIGGVIVRGILGAVTPGGVGALLPEILDQVNKYMGWDSKPFEEFPTGPWDALVNFEAGPGHSEPLRPKRPVSLD